MTKNFTTLLLLVQLLYPSAAYTQDHDKPKKEERTWSYTDLAILAVAGLISNYIYDVYERLPSIKLTFKNPFTPTKPPSSQKQYPHGTRQFPCAYTSEQFRLDEELVLTGKT